MPKFTVKAGKPRNPFALPAAMRKAGAHQPDAKTRRQREREQVRKHIHGALAAPPFT